MKLSQKINQAVESGIVFSQEQVQTIVSAHLAESYASEQVHDNGLAVAIAEPPPKLGDVLRAVRRGESEKLFAHCPGGAVASKPCPARDAAARQTIRRRIAAAQETGQRLLADAYMSQLSPPPGPAPLDRSKPGEVIRELRRRADGRLARRCPRRAHRSRPSGWARDWQGVMRGR